MKCPACGYVNIKGEDECASCQQDLRSVDGLIPRTKIEKILMSDPVSKLLPKTPITIEAAANVLDAAKKMNEARVGSLLVVNLRQDLEGIVTEHDLVVKGLADSKNLANITVGSIMTKSPEVLSAEDSLAYAVNRMSVGSYRHLPIMKDGKPTGVISVRDVLGYLSKLFP